MTTPAPSYVQFVVASDDALRRLRQVVAALGAVKRDQVTGPPAAPEHPSWREFFTPDELARFWDPDEAELQRWATFWKATPVGIRLSDQMPQHPWHFESMIEMILTCEYDLLGVAERDDKEAVVEFYPHAYPYGGTESLRALVRAFGHTVVGCDDGTGYEPGDWQPPPWDGSA